jgi:hypothetical protein
MFKVTVTGMASVSASTMSGGEDDGGGMPVEQGVVTSHTAIVFSSDIVSLAGTGADAGSKSTLFDKGWKFEDLGVGGLGKQVGAHFANTHSTLWRSPLGALLVCLRIPSVLIGPWLACTWSSDDCRCGSSARVWIGCSA